MLDLVMTMTFAATALHLAPVSHPLEALAPQDVKKEKSESERPMKWTGVLGEKEFAALHELKKGTSPRRRGKDIRVGKAKAYLSLPKGAKPTAAVLVIHEWWGLNDHVRHWTDRLAADGYAALAIDLYGGVVATTRGDAMEAMQAVDPKAATATLLAAHEFLAKDPRVKAKKRACIGWCFGGGWSLRLAMAAPDLDAAVVYYGQLIDDVDDLKAIRAPMLGVFGNKDRGIPPKSVDGFAAAMKKADRPLQLLRYDANHAFANPSSARYDHENAAKAWRGVRAFLRQHLGAPAGAAMKKGTFTTGGTKIEYGIPAGWEPNEGSSMRVVSFAMGKSSECYVVVLGGGGGGVGPNINRWRDQMGEEALTEDELDDLPRMKVLGAKSVLVSIDGTLEGAEDSRMLGLVCPLDGRTLFVKMIGPQEEVAGHEAKFKAFCSSLRRR